MAVTYARVSQDTQDKKYEASKISLYARQIVAIIAPGSNDQRGDGMVKGADDAVKREFAARLERLRIDRGLGQSELAKRATGYMNGKQISRGSIWAYERGTNFPGDAQLAALAKALGVSKTDLAPQLAGQRPEIEGTLETARVPDQPGKMRLVINGVYPTAKVLKVLEILEDVSEKG
jgi:transcriptional regulator with XRE-family HTH domain